MPPGVTLTWPTNATDGPDNIGDKGGIDAQKQGMKPTAQNPTPVVMSVMVFRLS
jgi:hypothetical protein